MYTRCPHCQTVFSLTSAQLKVRAGLVRCGRCQQTFHADRALLDGPLQAVAASPPRIRAERADGHGRARPPKPGAGAGRRREKRARDPARAPRVETATVAQRAAAPVRTRTVFWWLGNLLLIATLAGQGTYFYGDALVELEPAWRPAVTEFCDLAGCRLRPRQDVALIDLADAHVEPHPLYDRALRVHAVLVNRADFAQPHPDIEIALTNRDGAVVTRRSFTAAEYLGVERARGGGMPPGLTVEVQLDVTQPEARTVGYEIRLLAAR